MKVKNENKYLFKKIPELNQIFIQSEKTFHTFIYFLNTLLYFSEFKVKTQADSRERWKRASQALMCDRKALPRPWPSLAPLTSPAMSVTLRKAGTLLQENKAIKQQLKKT